MALNHGDFVLTIMDGLSHYWHITMIDRDRLQNISLQKEHIHLIETQPRNYVYDQPPDKIKEINLTDPLLIEIMETHCFNPKYKKEFSEWLRKKLVAECGEEILKSKITAKDFLNPDAFIQLKVIESDEQLGFIHIHTTNGGRIGNI